ncbi:MAG: hypothetical protein PUP91_13225 [Rhizonema sp. PD37]|nr:hypothetical protein [Rhizonema sp. PD37]
MSVCRPCTVEARSRFLQIEVFANQRAIAQNLCQTELWNGRAFVKPPYRYRRCIIGDVTELVCER